MPLRVITRKRTTTVAQLICRALSSLMQWRVRRHSVSQYRRAGRCPPREGEARPHSTTGSKSCNTLKSQGMLGRLPPRGFRGLARRNPWISRESADFHWPPDEQNRALPDFSTSSDGRAPVRYVISGPLASRRRTALPAPPAEISAQAPPALHSPHRSAPKHTAPALWLRGVLR